LRIRRLITELEKIEQKYGNLWVHCETLGYSSWLDIEADVIADDIVLIFCKKARPFFKYPECKEE